MALALISVILIIVLLLLAIRFGLNRDRISCDDDCMKHPLIHASGIYSIVRSSPRENIMSAKPSKDDLIKYISGLNEDINGNCITKSDKSNLIRAWEIEIEESITKIENGDAEHVEFYYYDFFPSECPICKRYLSKGTFVTREEIFLHPGILPPLHLGCTCKLVPCRGKDNLRETTEIGLLPFFKNRKLPVLPDWKNTIIITSI